LATEYAHYSLHKSVVQLGGLGQDIKVKDIEPDDFKMSVTVLEDELKALRDNGESIMAIWTIAGETETGKVDDFQAISYLAQKYDVPFIVDGAFGAPYRISRVGQIFDGMEEAFSITIDPHKTLYEPYQAGALLVKNCEDHALIGVIQKSYYAGFSEGYQNILEDIRNNQGHLGQKRLSGSMGSQGILATLASIRSLGFEGYKTIYDLTLDRISHLHERLSQSDILYPLHEPDINLLCFGLQKEIQAALGLENNDELGRYVNTSRENLDKGITGQGGYHFSTTKLPLGNKLHEWVFRACIMNPRTTNGIIDSAIDELEENIRGDLR
jgi:aromatic-L-amino-acid/L-tryptophan decarboxylase